MRAEIEQSRGRRMFAENPYAINLVDSLSLLAVSYSYKDCFLARVSSEDDCTVLGANRYFVLSTTYALRMQEAA